MTDLGLTELRALAEAVKADICDFNAIFALNTAASPDVILALCDRLAEAEAILNDLATSGHSSDYQGQCAMCLRGRPSDGPNWGHAADCPWRRAVEFWKGKQP